jgi:hypothetical protein
MTKLVVRILTALTLSAAAYAPSKASAQGSPDMNFFVAVEGARWGADQPALEVSDQQCTDLAYAQGYGHLTWRAYLNGTAADGEADQVARQRIGAGPWFNYYGVEIAGNIAQLHSDENNLWGETAITVLGEYPPDGVLEIPMGSALDGRLFNRAGPFFCFGVP